MKLLSLWQSYSVFAFGTNTHSDCSDTHFVAALLVWLQRQACDHSKTKAEKFWWLLPKLYTHLTIDTFLSVMGLWDDDCASSPRAFVCTNKCFQAYLAHRQPQGGVVQLSEMKGANSFASRDSNMLLSWLFRCNLFSSMCQYFGKLSASDRKYI